MILVVVVFCVVAAMSVVIAAIFVIVVLDVVVVVVAIPIAIPIVVIWVSGLVWGFFVPPDGYSLLRDRLFCLRTGTYDASLRSRSRSHLHSTEVLWVWISERRS